MLLSTVTHHYPHQGFIQDFTLGGGNSSDIYFPSRRCLRSSLHPETEEGEIVRPSLCYRAIFTNERQRLGEITLTEGLHEWQGAGMRTGVLALKSGKAGQENNCTVQNTASTSQGLYF